MFVIVTYFFSCSRSTSEDTTVDAFVLEKAIKENDVVKVKHFLIEHRGKFQVSKRNIGFLHAHIDQDLIRRRSNKFDRKLKNCSVLLANVNFSQGQGGFTLFSKLKQNHNSCVELKIALMKCDELEFAFWSKLLK